MRRLLKMTAVLLTAALLGGCGAAATDVSDAPDPVRLMAVSVGKGDALLLQIGEYACLIDAGKAKAMGKVRAAMAWMGIEALDAVFVTHTDDDHVGGLEWLSASDIPVGAWYASGLFTEVKEAKHPARQAAEARGQDIVWLKRGDRVALGDTGAEFRVLAPSGLFEDKDDNNSLVMMLETDQGRMLFTGDMELAQESVLLSEETDLACAVLKAPNHGDDDTLGEVFIRRASAQAAIISTDSYEKPGSPDPGVLQRLEDAGTACWVTQDAELGVLATLAGGTASVSLVDLDAPVVEGPQIRRVDAADDVVELVNNGPDADLGGWYLVSSRGGELFAFPEGTSLAAGATLTVGSRSTDGGYDLLWDDKKVVHKSKDDTITLYDACGRVMDAMGNGN